MSTKLHSRSVLLAFAATVGLLSAVGQAGANERRCSELGADCACSEPLNTATEGGGSGDWTNAYDPDDSPDATECSSRAEVYCASPMQPVSAAGQPLPTGHSLSWVLKRAGNSICHLSHPNVSEVPDVTYCMRAYRRWDQNSYIPGPNTANNEQQKIMTLGGIDPEGNFNPQQMSVHDDGGMATRSDGNWFNPPVDFQEIGNMRECTSNFCRFELCVDFRPVGGGLGKARTRMRVTTIPPAGSSASPVTRVVVKPEGSKERSTWQWDGAAGPNGLAFYAQGPGTFITYVSHYIVGKSRPYNSNFWIGPACEVEGGCNGGPPPPPPPPPAAPAPPFLLD